MNFAGTTRPTSHLKKVMDPVSCLIMMKKMQRALMFCVKHLNLVTFRYRTIDFHVKNIDFLISVAFD